MDVCVPSHLNRSFYPSVCRVGMMPKKAKYDHASSTITLRTSCTAQVPLLYTAAVWLEDREQGGKEARRRGRKKNGPTEKRREKNARCAVGYSSTLLHSSSSTQTATYSSMHQVCMICTAVCSCAYGVIRNGERGYVAARHDHDDVAMSS